MRTQCNLHVFAAASAILACSGLLACSKSDSGTIGSAGSSSSANGPSDVRSFTIHGTSPAPTAASSVSPSSAGQDPSAARVGADAGVAAGPTGATSAAASPAKDDGGGSVGANARPKGTSSDKALHPASARVGGKNFTLDIASPGCRVDVPCAVTIGLVASGGYHVNKEYPYKFTAAPARDLVFLGTAEPNVFSRAAGDFREDGETRATMTVRMKPSASGQANVAGTYKLSVCSAENCQIEAQPIELSVPVL